MKNKSNFLLLFAAILLSAVFIFTTSCTIGDGKEKSSMHDSLSATRYSIKQNYGDSETVIASVITYADTIGEEPITGAKQVIMHCIHYTCPCGRTGVILPPYTIDTIHN